MDYFSVEEYIVPIYAKSSDEEMEKHASYPGSGLQECKEIMDRIYKEDPSYWPYGLSVAGHDALYLVRDKMTKQAAGFVGWQESYDNYKRIGSYTIGILPEYRKHGLAKEAVAKIIRMKQAGVDEVRAYVMPHNKRSMALAKSVGINPTCEF